MSLTGELTDSSSLGIDISISNSSSSGSTTKGVRGGSSYVARSWAICGGGSVNFTGMMIDLAVCYTDRPPNFTHISSIISVSQHRPTISIPKLFTSFNLITTLACFRASLSNAQHITSRSKNLSPSISAGTSGSRSSLTVARELRREKFMSSSRFCISSEMLNFWI